MLHRCSERGTGQSHTIRSGEGREERRQCGTSGRRKCRARQHLSSFASPLPALLRGFAACREIYLSTASWARVPRKEPQADEKSHERGRRGKFIHICTNYTYPMELLHRYEKKSLDVLTIKNKAPPPGRTKPVKRRKKSLARSGSGSWPDVRSTSRHTQPGCHRRTCTAGSSPRA